MGERLAPVKLCCGQRHNGPVCPDGKVMCTLCYERVSIDDLNVVSIDFEGQHEDVCKPCAEMEKRLHRRGPNCPSSQIEYDHPADVPTLCDCNG